MPFFHRGKGLPDGTRFLLEGHLRSDVWPARQPNSLPTSRVLSNSRAIPAFHIIEYDLEKLKEKAKNDGIPYQTLISMVLHKYITNQLLEKSELLKSIQILRNKEGV